jgi:hypothetical protein
MPEPVSRCLRCGKRRPVATWQCAECAALFEDWDERDRVASIRGLEEDERALLRIANQLDGAGFWAAGRATLRAAEEVMRLRDAIAADPPWRARR